MTTEQKQVEKYLKEARKCVGVLTQDNFTIEGKIYITLVAQMLQREYHRKGKK